MEVSCLGSFEAPTASPGKIVELIKQFTVRNVTLRRIMCICPRNLSREHAVCESDGFRILLSTHYQVY